MFTTTPAGTELVASAKSSLRSRVARRLAALAAVAAVLAALAGGTASNASAGVRFDDGAQATSSLVCDQTTGSVTVGADHFNLGWNIWYSYQLYLNGSLQVDWVPWRQVTTNRTLTNEPTRYHLGRGTWQALIVYAHATPGDLSYRAEWAQVEVKFRDGSSKYFPGYTACIA